MIPTKLHCNNATQKLHTDPEGFNNYSLFNMGFLEETLNMFASMSVFVLPPDISFYISVTVKIFGLGSLKFYPEISCCPLARVYTSTCVEKCRDVLGIAVHLILMHRNAYLICFPEERQEEHFFIKMKMFNVVQKKIGVSDIDTCLWSKYK